MGNFNHNSIYDTVRYNIRKYRKLNKMTQQELADLVGTTQATVNRWLKGVNEPDLATLLEICLYLGVSPNEILGYDDISDDDFKIYCQTPEIIERTRTKQSIAKQKEAFENEEKKLEQIKKDKK